ncbi:sodium-dependent glucose transporter 1B-like [Mizuhopecten yessoensis]|uniref:Sodium-dependent glucose transporter 1A n=1 Tax=Mizuhopecten yessoensis TaxID=6573 RepID=A0A210QML2_MIZYE|nr:sodium-dependent glucose transporter 1B-like [Mizuhopecten yessoensis]XP_021354532.1 sodium-dependent glucose transporter 1B-like [Mizuhopecten yessoensis]OWF49965.1 Sodium-dependent glucose transporter 1A [Mizuhopecten yessoensis]
MSEQETFGIDYRSVDSNEGLQSGACSTFTCCHSGSGTCGNVVVRYKKEPLFRQNITRSACLYLSLFTLGFAKGQIGPSLIDLQIISGVGLTEGAALLTTVYAVYMAGACLGGVIYNKMRRTFILAGSNILLAVATLAIPWCSFYWLMLVAFSLFGLSLGVTDSVASGDLQYTWGKDGRPYMQGMQLLYAIGVTVSPLIAAPFLSSSVPTDFRRNESDIDSFLYTSNETTLSTNLTCFESALHNMSTNVSKSTDHITNEKSQLYLSYMFTTIFSVFACLAFLAFYFRFERQTQDVIPELSVSKDYNTRDLPRSMKCLALGLLVSISGLICCIDDTFLGFLTTFCVKYLKWTKSQGAVLSSASCSIVVVGRILAVVIIQFISPMTLVGFHCFVTMLSFVGLYISAVHVSSMGVYISALGFGFGKSAILPSVFSWIEEIVSPVSGKISAMVFFVITALTAINPVILGNMMENLADIWFALLLLAESIVLLLVYTAAAVLSKYIIAVYGYTYREQEIVIENSPVNQPEVTNKSDHML